jgi:YD repeat-containing protein
VGGGGILAEYVYGADDRLATIYEGPGSHSFAIRRDAAGRLTRIFEQTGHVPPQPTGREMTYTWRPDGLPQTMTSHSVTTTFGYHATTANLVSTIDTVGRTRAMSYDDAGNLVFSSDGQASWTFGYDANNRVTSVKDGEQNETVLGYTQTACGCSERSLVTSIHTPDLLPLQAWRFEYGPSGRLAKAFDPEGREEAYAYHPTTGQLTGVTDRNNQTTQFAYDQLGRLTNVVDALNRSHGRSYPVPDRFKWNGPSLMAGSPDGTSAPKALNGHLRSGEYQIGENGYDSYLANIVTDQRRSRGFPQVSFYRDATFELSYGHSWDDAGRLTHRDDRAGKPINETAFPGGTGQYDNQHWGWSLELPHSMLGTYDAAGTSTFIRRWNSEYDVHTVEQTQNEVLYLYTRDTAGRVTRLQRRYFGNGIFFGPESTYDYYPNGYLKQIVNADGTHDLAYDARGLLRTITIPGEGVYTFEYDVAGRNRALTHPDGHQRIQAYDPEGRITSRCYRYPGNLGLDRCYGAKYDPSAIPSSSRIPRASTPSSTTRSID